MRPLFRKVIFPVITVLLAIGVFSVWWSFAPPGLWGKMKAIGYAVCHQIGSHSFHIGDRPLPLCARCSGMYLGAVIGLLYQMWRVPKRGSMPHWSVFTVLGIFLIAFVVDGVNSYLSLVNDSFATVVPSLHSLYVPSNTLRLLTGSGVGLGLAIILFPTFNATLWKDVSEQPTFPGLQSFLPLLGLVLTLDLLVLTQSPWVLYPLALLSVLGVVGVLSMVYMVVWVTLTRQENVFTHVWQMWPILLLGLTTALFQIMAIDYGRLVLTGTWGAFPLSGH